MVMNARYSCNEHDDDTRVQGQVCNYNDAAAINYLAEHAVSNTSRITSRTASLHGKRV